MASAWLAASILEGINESDRIADDARGRERAAETFLSTLKDAETGQRGYLLTGDADYLEPYLGARKRLGDDLVRLRDAPHADNAEHVHIDRLERLADDKLAELARTIALHDAGRPGEALALVRTNQGQQTMQSIRGEISALNADVEHALVRDRAPAHAPWRWQAVITMSVLSTALLGGVALAQRERRLFTLGSLQRLERFTRAFGLAHGAIRSVEGRILFWTRGSEQMYGYSSAAAIGQLSDELLRTRYPFELAEIEAALQRDGVWQGELVKHRSDGTALSVASHWALHRGSNGEADVVIVIDNDVTPLRLAERQRSLSDTLLRTIVETAPGLIYAKDRDGRFIRANQAVLALLEKSRPEVEGRTDRDVLAEPAHAEAIMANDQALMREGRAEELEEVAGNVDGAPRFWSSHKAPLRDDAGVVVGLVGVSVEITERKRVEERLRQMINELNHRVNNTLTVVKAFTAQTLKDVAPATRRSLEGRLGALASVHDVLMRADWSGAEVTDLIGATLDANGITGSRGQWSGPMLRLSPTGAVAFALGINELAINAIGHGALAAGSDGSIVVTWGEARVEGIPQLQLTWRERAGPRVVEPMRRGFGMRLVERSFAGDLGGRVRFAFEASGLVCSIELPLSQLVASAPAALPAVGGR